MKGKFEVFKGKNRQWYFRLKARNGKIISQSEGYKTLRGALIGIRTVKKVGPKAPIVGV